MNLKLVLRTYSALRQLTDDESALLNTLRSLNDGERELLVESLSPGRKPTKDNSKPERCTHVYSSGTVCNGVARNVVHNLANHVDYHLFTTKKPATKSAGKSRRASELSDTLRQRAAGKATTATTGNDNDDPNEHCQKEFPGGIVCDEPADANVHHLQTATGYHEFQSGKSAAATAGD